jgi:hypothetical protein
MRTAEWPLGPSESVAVVIRRSELLSANSASDFHEAFAPDSKVVGNAWAGGFEIFSYKILGASKLHILRGFCP